MAVLRLSPIRKRADFLRLNRARRAAMPGLVLQAGATPPEYLSEDGMRLGLTVTKKIGNAVTRNRVRRRLRAVAQKVLPLAGKPGHDYVLIARAGTMGRSFDDLTSDLQQALRTVHRHNDKKGRAK